MKIKDTNKHIAIVNGKQVLKNNPAKSDYDKFYDLIEEFINDNVYPIGKMELDYSRYYRDNLKKLSEKLNIGYDELEDLMSYFIEQNIFPEYDELAYSKNFNEQMKIFYQDVLKYKIK